MMNTGDGRRWETKCRASCPEGTELQTSYLWPKTGQVNWLCSPIDLKVSPELLAGSLSSQLILVNNSKAPIVKEEMRELLGSYREASADPKAKYSEEFLGAAGVIGDGGNGKNVPENFRDVRDRYLVQVAKQGDLERDEVAQELLDMADHDGSSGREKLLQKIQAAAMAPDMLSRPKHPIKSSLLDSSTNNP